MEGMLSVFLVDDHSVFRSGVRAELSQAVNIVGEAGGVTEAIAGICTTHPDVVLLDVHMPDGGGQAVIQGVDTPTTFLALSVSDAAEDVISVIRAGARGYVTKTISGPELIDAVRRVHDGDAAVEERVAAGESAHEDMEDPDDDVLDALTRRELEVLRLLARGYTYKEIAADLFISVKTVETHSSNILRKTQQSNRHALTRWAHSRDLD